MASLSLTKEARMTPVNDRTKVQNLLVSLSNLWLNIRFWWPRHAKKCDVTTFRGEQFYETLVDFRTWALYTNDGYLYGWHGQDCDGDPFFTPASDVHGNKKIRMSWLSRLRSPKFGN